MARPSLFTPFVVPPSRLTSSEFELGLFRSFVQMNVIAAAAAVFCFWHVNAVRRTAPFVLGRQVARRLALSLIALV